QTQHVGIRTGGDVVDDLCAGLDRMSGDRGLRGVDRDRHPTSGQCLDDGQDSGELYLGRDSFRTRTGRLAAHVDEVGTLLGQIETVLDRQLGILVATTVREGVRSHVHYPHDQGAIEDQMPGPYLPTGGISHGFRTEATLPPPGWRDPWPSFPARPT